jgi:predicted ATPase/DNA-binding CsgD family transcriptional regulator
VPAGELIGRERELASLIAMLGDPEARLVTVTGPAGVGKTRLVLAASEAIAPDLPGGVVRVDLAAIEDARLVAEAIAVAAGAGSSRGASARDAAVAALRDQRALLVLDNFEQVIAAAADLGALLDACPGVAALVTSRHVLWLSAERTLPLAPLATPAADADPTHVTAAVALFVARAQARDPSFELTPEVAAAVAEICRRLDGLPLAIELAAARVAVLAPPAMLARWDAAVGLDTEGARDLPSRQRTLRSAFDWSYDLLEADEQALLRRLAAFADAFDVQAVEAAQRGDGGVLAPLELDPLSTLAALVDRSLLHREAGSGAEPRFTMLVTVRSYLRERLAQCGEAAAADLWMATVCAAAVHHEDRVFGAGCSGDELDRFDRELNNIRAALEVLLARAPERALELCADLFRLWQARHVREGGDWLGRALAAAADAPPATRVRGLFAAIWLAHFQGDYTARRRLADECLATARSADDDLILARALYVTSVDLIDRDPTAAEARYRESLALCERLGDVVGIATASNDLGELARAAGAFDEAQALYGRALELWRAAGDGTGIARGAHNLAQAARDVGDLQRAADLLRESLAASARMGDRHQRAATLAGVVTVAAERHPGTAAATLYGAAEAELAAAEVVLDPIDEEPFMRAEAALQTVLGEERAREAQARGRELELEQTDVLVERLLAGEDDAAAPADGVLSQREREVVRFLAAGLTNAEIAGRLVLSEHTVHRHVANILVKLGARSRAAAAVTAAERGLL